MGSGYVLNFSNRTIEEFILDSTGRAIYDSRYDYGSGSKANRLRAFWNVEPNPVVGKLMGDILDYGIEENTFAKDNPLLTDCRKVAARLMQDVPVAELDALTTISDEKDFEVVAKAIRATIENNQPEVGLDRLHTFVVKYVRSLCSKHGIAFTRDKALHSLFGEYVKRLRDGGHIESEMTSRILKSSISILEAFNDVRNNQSLAHDNPILNYDEGLLIFNHIAGSIRFLRSLEGHVEKRARVEPADDALDDVPF
jgi:hypothetical protein